MNFKVETDKNYMRSRIKQLELRGYVDAGIEKKYIHLSTEQRTDLLKSNSPTERTIGARLLTNYSNVSAIEHLIEALVLEKKLYPKIEICNSLVSFGKESVGPLILLLGKIGENQYREIPETVFKKKNFPLPRDVAARSLIRIGLPALPDLLKCLKSDNLSVLSEAIDAIGHICFYNKSTNVYRALKECINTIYINDLIRWKIYRAMSAFPESRSFLMQQKLTTGNEYLKIETERSLKLINNRDDKIKTRT
jgi:hypothetical protein